MSSLNKKVGIHALAILDQTEPLGAEALRRLVENAVLASMRAIEIPFGPDWLTATPEEVAEIMNDYNMAVALCDFHIKEDPLDGGAGEAAAAKKFEYEMKALVEMRKGGADIIGLTGPSLIQIGLAYDGGAIDRAARFAAKHVAPIAKQLGIDVFVEALCKAEDGVINTSRRLLTLLEGVGCERVKAHLDTFHLDLNGENPAEAMQVLGKRLGVLHASGRRRDLASVGIDWKLVRAGLEAAPDCKWIIGEALGQKTREKLGLISGAHGLAPAADGDAFMRDLEKTLIGADIIEP